MTKFQNNIINYGLIGLVILLIGLWWRSADLPIPENEKNKPVDQILAQDWVLGNPNALIKVVEYSDLQCPACQAYRETDDLLVKTFGDRVGVAFRHFPLRSIHKNANIAAQAAEAAGKQGKFWEMAAILFEKQAEWSESSNILTLFVGYAKQVGINEQQFTKDIGTRETKALVEADYLSGLIAKVNATPTFIVNGQKMNNLRGPQDLVDRVDLMLREATSAGTQQ